MVQWRNMIRHCIFFMKIRVFLVFFCFLIRRIMTTISNGIGMQSNRSLLFVNNLMKIATFVKASALAWYSAKHCVIFVKMWSRVWSCANMEKVFRLNTNCQSGQIAEKWGKWLQFNVTQNPTGMLHLFPSSILWPILAKASVEWRMCNQSQHLSKRPNQAPKS